MSRVGIVFSGGIGKGAYEVGFCKAFLAAIPFEQVAAISGASIGCLNAYAFATKQLPVIEEVWKSTDFKNMREFYNSLVKRPVILDYVDRFGDTPELPAFPVVVTCIQTPMIKLKYIDIMKYRVEVQKQMLKACISIPTLMKPIEVAGRKYIDGAVLDNTPVGALKNQNLDLIFVLRFDHCVEDYSMIGKNVNIIEVVFQEESFIRDSFALDNTSTTHMLEKGESYGTFVLEKVLKYGLEDKEYIRYAASSFNRGSKAKIIPKNGDDIIRKINKLSKMFRE